jgi:hypothetical protein
MDSLNPLRELVSSWRTDAARLREYGAEGQARACEKHAEALEDRMREWELQLLTLGEASEETGLSYDTVQRKVAAGDWPNRGVKGSPRVRRCDLYPGVPGPELEPTTDGGTPDLAEEILRTRESTEQK